DLPTALFTEQMAYLTAETEVVGLGDGLRRLADGTQRRSMVAVTFDDGTAEFAEVALPVLEEHDVTVALFVAQPILEGRRTFTGGCVPLSGSALGDAVSTGLVDVGSHTHGHALLDRLPPDRIDDELDQSIELVGERLHVQPRHFAYPKAVMGSSAADTA